MNTDQHRRDVLFISVLAMYRSNKKDLKTLTSLAQSLHGDLYHIMPSYMGSELQLQINATAANINYAMEKMDTIICLN